MLRVLKKHPPPTPTTPAPSTEWQQRAYQKCLQKISFAYTYGDLKIQPLTGFYKYLTARTADPEQPQLHLQIPDTIVFGEGDGPMWFYTDKKGVVAKKENFSLEKLVERFSKGHEDTDVIAIMKKTEGEGSGNISQPMTRAELFKLVMSGATGKFVLQRYVRTRSGRASIARCVWRRYKPSYVWTITNKV